jgi:hypothetical protein
MKKFFYSHPDTVIAAFALIFIGILVGLYSWASNDVFTEVHQALTSSPAQSSDSFDLAGAGKLDLRGLVSNPSTSPAPTTSTPAQP